MTYKFAIELDSEGNPIGHPMSIENLKTVISSLTVENKLPENYCWFQQVPKPRLGIFEKNQTHNYEMVNGVCMDVWRVEHFSEQEKIEKIEEIRQNWLTRGGYPSWEINPETGEPTPPVPRPQPQDNTIYRWNEQDLSWVEYIEELPPE